MRRIVFLGPPGVGKGTQAAELAREWKIPHLSTGDLLRSAVAEKSALGREAEGHMKAGRLVPDDLVLQILRERLARPDATDGFILDGYPRNPAQAAALDAITPIDRVISFDLPVEVLQARMVDRRVCPACQTVYNITTSPPRVAGHCDRDGAVLVHRPDDRPEAVATRLKVYRDQTAPLLSLYSARGVLQPVDAHGTPDEVRRRIRRLVP